MYLKHPKNLDGDSAIYQGVLSFLPARHLEICTRVVRMRSMWGSFWRGTWKVRRCSLLCSVSAKTLRKCVAGCPLRVASPGLAKNTHFEVVDVEMV